MKIFHTADWHLGKIVQGVHMTEDQRFVLREFIQHVKEEKPDAIIIAGDLYDRAIPPTEAVHLLNETLEELVLDLHIPTLIIAGNHDSPGRLDFGSKIMESRGLHIVGKYDKDRPPLVLEDEYGEVHFHLIPFCDPSVVRQAFEDEEIRSFDDAMKRIVEHIEKTYSPEARQVFVGHAFVTPGGRPEENTSASEVTLSVGGAEHVSNEHFEKFTYTALGHLHRAHRVGSDNIRYAGSLLKYSISEENHDKGYYVVDITGDDVEIEKRTLTPRRDMYTITASIDEIQKMEERDDYVFIELTDQTPVLSPMEKVRAIFPNALHVKRKYLPVTDREKSEEEKDRREMTDVELFESFYKEITGEQAEEEMLTLFKEVMDEQLDKQRKQ